MNEHEAERIAGAVNVLRPDWPVASLLTLMRKSLMTRPRRDVAVALAWVASDSETKTPARVMEPGPWWRAVGTEGADPKAPAEEKCGFCGYRKSVCETYFDDHGFEGQDAWMRRRLPDEAQAKRAAEARALLLEAKGVTTTETDGESA